MEAIKQNQCELQLGYLSNDCIYSRNARLGTIKRKTECKGMKNTEVKFLLVEGTTMEVAKKYALI